MENWAPYNVILSMFFLFNLALSLSRIYFDTPTFDRITNDQAAKFVDILSTIGGTMGLLTGFSIISGIEIIFFVVKIILSLTKKKMNTLKSNLI